ncbi:MAG: hypothetical protein LBP19_09770 [Treponema sp.]|nr:hypothetical protein [Treponema sp.]
MKKNLFYKVVFGMALAASLVLAGCGEEASVDFPALDAPDVAATAIKGGVKLQWKAVIGADGYEIFRREGSGIDKPVGTLIPLSGPIDPATGKYVWRDLENLSETSVKPSTAYTYTVVAKSDDAKQEARKSVAVTTTAFLGAKAKLAAPADVTLAADTASNVLTVTVTPGADGDVIAAYMVELKKDGQTLPGGGSPGYLSYPQTSWQYSYDPATLASGRYTAVVSTYADNSYYDTGDAIKVSNALQFESLFGPNASISASSVSSVFGTDALASTVVNYSAPVALSGLIPDVTYTIERATADETTGTATSDRYVAVTLSKYDASAPSGYADVTSITTDALGNTGIPNLYDRRLPVTGGTFFYRIKAVKGDTTQYKYISESFLLTINPKTKAVQSISSISVAAKNTETEGKAIYAVTPSITYKGILPANSKLVIYWLKSGSISDYQYGKYASKIEFTKDNLEAATIAAKNIEVAVEAGDSSHYVYAQAYLEFEDGTRTTLNSWNGSSAGVDDTDDYYLGSTQIYYAELDY